MKARPNSVKGSRRWSRTGKHMPRDYWQAKVAARRKVRTKAKSALKELR